MDTQHRGRAASTGQRAHIRHTPSPSPHAPFHANVSGLGFDPLLSAAPNPSTNFAVTTGGFDGVQYLPTAQSQQFLQPSTLVDQSFFPGAQNFSQHNTPQFGPQGNNISPDPLDLTNNSTAFGTFFAGNSISPSYLSNTLDPQLLDAQLQQNQSINPSDLMNQMTTSQAQVPTPPHLLPNMSHRTPSPHASPNLSQGAFSPPNSRHASTTLGPNAAYGQVQGPEWGSMAAFRGHRRAPSETAYSDVSSAHASPYLAHHDSFEETQPSPLLHAQADPQLFQDPVMQFNQFTLNENNSHISPGQSPGPSPRLLPQQQALPNFQPGSFGLEHNINNPYGQHVMPTYQNQTEPFPSLNQAGPEFGAADTMSPPEINIDFAPPSRQASFEPPKPEHRSDALSPPDRSRSRNRTRAKSDPFSGASSRASTPGLEANRSLSPSAAKSRSPSPSGKSSRRSSTSSVPNRDYILDLADPSRPAPLDGSNPKRTQKHPATFQCTLCPKRFTRAYNLRSHLRTHTDERPFVCNHCGKAFARQHDRKRHEGLHSGEKKFVCRGSLKDNGHWGCDRRFARADALGRHFRSEAGRVCIRPLLEEEARERGDWDVQSQQLNNTGGMYGAPMSQNYGGMMSAQGGFEPFPAISGSMSQAPPTFLPAALLAQYPALAGIQWDQLPPGGPDEMDGDISGRSSFDASSGNEYFDEESDYQAQQQPVYGGGGSGGNGGWTSDYDGR